jgi:hypothetical protein
MVLYVLNLRRFDLTKGLLFETFFIIVWYKLCHCDHGVGIISTYNKLVDRIRNFESNAYQLKQIF